MRLPGFLKSMVKWSTHTRNLQEEVDILRLTLVTQQYQRKQALDRTSLDELRRRSWRENWAQLSDYVHCQLSIGLDAVHTQSKGQGFSSVYPDCAMPSAGPLSRQDQALQRRGQSLSAFATAEAPVNAIGDPVPTPLPASSSWVHPDGFQLNIAPSSIDHPAAGYGVFVRRDLLPAGAVAALYPGFVYSPPQLTDSVIEGNDYLISRYDGYVVDGRGWHLHARQLHLRAQNLELLAGGGGAASAARPLRKFRNPWAVGNYINHPPPGSQPNVMAVQFDVLLETGSNSSLSSAGGGTSVLLTPSLMDYIPNRSCADQAMLDRGSATRSQMLFRALDDAWGARLRGIALVALRAIEPDEELFLNYRLNPSNPAPEWYQDPQPEDSARRWARIKKFL